MNNRFSNLYFNKTLSFTRRLLRFLLIITAISHCVFTSSATAAATTDTDKHRLNSLSILNEKIKEKQPAGLIESKLITIKGGDLPWINSDIELKKGQTITFLLEGELDFGGNIKIEPGVAFWAGFGQKKPMYVAGQNTATIPVPQSGQLYVARSLAEWKNQQGELDTPVEYYQAVKGNIYALVLVWNSDPQKGLLELIDRGINHPLIATESQRIKSPSPVPEGWHNMWLFGNNGIFKDNNAGKNTQIDVFTHKDVGILQKEVDFTLTPGTTIHWEWIVDLLPSPLPEDAPHTHDYLSVAVEFDDGQDLTYMWSNGLPEGKHFRCPLARWTPIETHYVIRSDKTLLGQWLTEKRDVYSDYHKMIGGNAKRITRIWFIANTVFQSGFGKASFRNIQIKTK